MVKAIRLTGLAITAWWREFMMLTLFNIAWLFLQVPLVTGPPATAAMFVIAQRVADGEILDPVDGWHALRRVFIPALKWGILNLLVILTVVGNFWAYRAEIGLPWTVLRLLWGMIAVAWFTINLFYWPFWMHQDDHSIWTTLRNSLVFIARQPILAITLALISAVLIVGGVLTTLPLTAVLMAWLALIGVFAIGEELGR
jgi:hypothetical protein